MKQILKFIYSCKALTIGFVISFSIFISYELTMEWPELIPYGDFYYNLASQLGLAYMGSFVFYIIQVYIPELQNKKKLNETLTMRLTYIYVLMQDPIREICNYCLDEEFNMTDITEKQWKEISKNIDLNKKISMPNRMCKDIPCIDAILIYIGIINKEIDKTYMCLGFYLDIEILKLLGSITMSGCHLIFPEFKDGFENSFCVELLKEYSELYNKLLEYINNI